MSEPSHTQETPEKSWSLQIVLPLLVLSVALNAVIVVYYLKMHQYDRDRVVLREEREQGTYVRWKLRGGEEVTVLPALWEMVAGAHPIELNVRDGKGGTDWARIQEVAAIFARHGTMEELNIYTRETADMEAWMKHLGAQPKLRFFLSFSASFSDEASTFLAGYPAVEGTSIQSANLTGEKFPLLPALQAADFTGCDITPTGLRRIMTCPSLRDVKVRPDHDPSPELLQTYHDLKKAHPGVSLWGLD